MKTLIADDATEVITSLQMRKLEADAMASGRVTGAALMERAGASVVAAVTQVWPGLTGRAAVLCGPGNNGGDGYVIARKLARHMQVEVFGLGSVEDLPADARLNHDRWLETQAVAPLSEAGPAMAEAELIVDAVFGIGLRRPIDDGLGTLLASAPSTARRVAVDVPSGWSADEARPLGRHWFPADLTVTFHAPKPVHPVLAARGQTVIIAGIGL